ncbi:hypothetical protein ACFE04_011080 [Oxalis oulophora]
MDSKKLACSIISLFLLIASFNFAAPNTKVDDISPSPNVATDTGSTSILAREIGVVTTRKVDKLLNGNSNDDNTIIHVPHENNEDGSFNADYYDGIPRHHPIQTN